MLEKTRGIVLRTVDYSETSIVANIYTEAFGIQSFLIKGAKRKKSSVRSNLFQPLSLLELVIYKKEKSHLHSLKEVRVELPYLTIPYNLAKTSILFFLNEILLRCLHEEENNSEEFQFIHETLQLLDNSEKHFNNLHIIFLVRFSRFLGFFPQGNFSLSTQVFDLREGKFIQKEPLHHDYLIADDSALFNKLLLHNYYSMDQLIVSGNERKNLLTILLRYYNLHLENMKNITSLKVLEDIFT